MPVRRVPLCGVCVSLLILAGLAVDALAACMEQERHARLPAPGCSPAAIEAICTGQRPMPTTDDCGGREPPLPLMGDRCETSTGGCL